MTNKSMATALTLGLVAFTLSVLLVTTSEAACVKREIRYSQEGCLPSEGVETRRAPIPGGGTVTIGGNLVYRFYRLTCCTSERQNCQAQGKLWEAGTCINRPVKQMGKNTPREPSGRPISPALVKAACEKRGGQYDPNTGGCTISKSMGKNAPPREGGPRSPALVKAECEKQGYRYDPDTGRCIVPEGVSEQEKAAQERR